MLTLGTVKDAASVLSEVARKTDLILSKTLLEGHEIYLKSENLQLTGSLKLRGAYYKISKLTDEQKARGIIACSAGNHAQGVALAAQKNNIKAAIFIPATAPISKVEATRKYGAEIMLIDGVYDDAYKAACEYQKETNGEFIHPFNNEDVIAGQGTIGLEILEQLRNVDSVIVPIGGGGLISGIAFAIKQIKPDCKVYGVQAQGAGSMYQSFLNKKILELPHVNTFADGTAVKKPGDLTFELCMKYVDDIVTVTDDEIASAILALMERQKLVAEGAGALSVAAAMFRKLPIENKKTVCIVSGGNIDVNILSRVITRGLMMTGRNVNLTIELVDKPGQLQQVSEIIARCGANVVSVYYDHGDTNMAINSCFLKLALETRDSEQIEAIRRELASEGFRVVTERV